MGAFMTFNVGAFC